jgi:hypothetical protein
MNNFDCKICNKVYKNKSGKWKHDNKYHTIPALNSTILHQNDTLSAPNSTILHQNVIHDLQCTFCNKIFTRKSSLNRHYKICSNKLSNNNNLIKENNIIKKEFEEFKIQISNLLKQAKIPHKTLQQINKNLINGNNNSNNNNTINNNIQIIKFGSENIKNILNEKEILKILNSRYCAIEESIKEIHFNKSRPEYRNILITNLRDNIAYVYNGNTFEAVQKNSVISDLIDQHMNNIEVSLENYKHKLPEKTANILDKLLEKLEDDETKITDENNNKEYKNFKLYKTNEIKLMIYNESKKNMEVIKFHL